MIQTVKLIRKKTIANGTMEFFLEKPKDFSFRAGQFCEFTLINPPETDDEGTTRAFSLVTAPFELELSFATRLRDSAFKRIIKDLSDGSLIKLDGPYGDFTLHKTESTPAVFVIGGIGVTPVRSMIAQATHDHTSHDITLFHSNRTLADAPFNQDFEKLAVANTKFAYIPVLTDGANDWKGEKGRVDETILKRHIADLKAPIYYLSGPEAMVKATRELLVSLRINEDNIRTEEFAGY